MSPTAVPPVSPTSGRPHKPVPRGFLAAPRPQQKSIYEMGVYELRARHRQNAESLTRAYVARLMCAIVLSRPLTAALASVHSGPSTSTYVQRITAEQAAIEDRLVKLGVENIEQMLQQTYIEDEKMNIDTDAPPPEPRPIGAKQRAIANYVWGFPIALRWTSLLTPPVCFLSRPGYIIQIQIPRCSPFRRPSRSNKRRIG